MWLPRARDSPSAGLPTASRGDASRPSGRTPGGPGSGPQLPWLPVGTLHPRPIPVGFRQGSVASLTVQEGPGPDEAGVPEGGAQKSPLQQRAVAPARTHGPQGQQQAEDGQALDQGADPGRLLLRDPEEEVGSAGQKEGAQPPAHVGLLWGTRGLLSHWSSASSGGQARPAGLRPRAPPAPLPCGVNCSGTRTSSLPGEQGPPAPWDCFPGAGPSTPPYPAAHLG